MFPAPICSRYLSLLSPCCSMCSRSAAWAARTLALAALFASGVWVAHPAGGGPLSSSLGLLVAVPEAVVACGDSLEHGLHVEDVPVQAPPEGRTRRGPLAELRALRALLPICAAAGVPERLVELASDLPVEVGHLAADPDCHHAELVVDDRWEHGDETAVDQVLPALTCQDAARVLVRVGVAV